jgi:hypothetical protein
MKKITLTILFVIICFSTYGNYYEIAGGTDSDLRSLISQWNGVGTIAIKGDVDINSNLDIPTGINLQFFKGNKFIVKSHIALKINGTIRANAYQIFVKNLNSEIYINSTDRHIYPNWFGNNYDSLNNLYSSKPIQDAIYSLSEKGGLLEFVDNLWIITSDILVNSNNITFISNCNTTFQCPESKNSGNFFVIQGNDDTPIEQIRFDGLNFIGNDIPDSHVQRGIYIKSLPFNIWKSKEVTNKIKILNCSFSKFTTAVHLEGCKNVFINNCTFGNNVFNPDLSAGGYGILLESCFSIKITNNKFRAKEKDRHAVYVSVFGFNPEVISNENIHIIDNIMSWGGADLNFGNDVSLNYTFGPFKNAINVRSTKNLIISENTIDSSGVYGIKIGCTNADVDKVIVSNNILSNIRNPTKYQAGAIVFTNETTNNSISEVVVTDNVINVSSSFNNNMVGIDLDGVKIGQVENNVISIQGSFTYNNWPLKISESEHLNIGTNTIYSENCRYILTLFEELNNINIEAQNISGDYTELFGYFPNDSCAPYFCDFKDVRIKFPVKYVISSDGNGSVNMNERTTLKTNLITSISSDVNGFKITFAQKIENLNTIHVGTTNMSDAPYYLYVREMIDDGRGMIIGIKDSNGTPTSGENSNIVFKLEFNI